MRLPAFSVVLLFVGILPGFAFDVDSRAVLDRTKVGKLVPISDIAVLMMNSERWCYNERNGACARSDIYLSVDGNEASYEISSPWSESVDISLVDRGEFRDNRYICETNYDWVASVRAFSRLDGNVIEGRALDQLRQEIRRVTASARNDDCFDYLYRGADAEQETVTLLRRQYVDGNASPGNDVVVTLHFNRDTAEALDWYW